MSVSRRLYVVPALRCATPQIYSMHVKALYIVTQYKSPTQSFCDNVGERGPSFYSSRATFLT